MATTAERVSEPYPPPDEGDPPTPAPIPEPYPPDVPEPYPPDPDSWADRPLQRQPLRIRTSTPWT